MKYRRGMRLRFELGRSFFKQWYCHKRSPAQYNSESQIDYGDTAQMMQQLQRQFHQTLRKGMKMKSKRRLKKEAAQEAENLAKEILSLRGECRAFLLPDSETGYELVFTDEDEDDPCKGQEGILLVVAQDAVEFGQRVIDALISMPPVGSTPEQAFELLKTKGYPKIEGE